MKILDEIIAELSGQLSEKWMEGDFTEKDMQIFSLIDTLNELEDEQAVKEFLRVNSKDIAKLGLETKNTTVFSQALHTDPFGKEKTLDLKKEFNNPNILDEWRDKYTEDDIRAVANRLDIPYGTLVKRLEDETTKLQNYRFAHGGEWKDVLDGSKYNGLLDNPISLNLLGSLMTVFAPRQQEAYERGETPSTKDMLGDVGENLLYAIPYGRLGMVAKNAPKAAKVAKMLGGTASNFINPAIMEGYDALVYDDENNPRSNFSLLDVGAGGASNMIAPMILQRGVGRLSKSMPFLESLSELGEHSFDDALEIIRKNNARYDQIQGKALMGRLSDMSPEDRAFYKSYPRLKLNDDFLDEIAKQKGKTWGEKVENYLKNSADGEMKVLTIDEADGKPIIKERESQFYRDVPTETKAIESAEEILPIIENSPYADLDFYKLKPNSQILTENAVLNEMTNKFGDAWYSDRNIGIPLIGEYLNEALKEKETLDKYEKSKRDAYKRYKVNLLGE